MACIFFLSLRNWNSIEKTIYRDKDSNQTKYLLFCCKNLNFVHNSYGECVKEMFSVNRFNWEESKRWIDTPIHLKCQRHSFTVTYLEMYIYPSKAARCAWILLFLPATKPKQQKLSIISYIFPFSLNAFCSCMRFALVLSAFACAFAACFRHYFITQIRNVQLCLQDVLCRFTARY